MIIAMILFSRTPCAGEVAAALAVRAGVGAAGRPQNDFPGFRPKLMKGKDTCAAGKGFTVGDP